MKRSLPSLVLLAALFLVPAARAQATDADAGAIDDAGTLADAGTAGDGGSEDGGLTSPDASSGQGGAQQDGTETQDNSGRVVTVCQQSTDCSRGFTCRAGKCTYVGIRQATTEGCLAVFSAQTLVLLGLGLVWLRSRKS